MSSLFHVFTDWLGRIAVLTLYLRTSKSQMGSLAQTICLLEICETSMYGGKETCPTFPKNF